jgi:hypothetical protein
MQQLWPEPMPPGTKVFAIVDSARNDKIYPAVQASTLPWLCLYLGKIPKELEEVAPYLVELSKDDAFTKTLLTEGWGDNWGIFFWAPAELEDLRKHFRQFLTVLDPEGKQIVFRYYDPRVFRPFLPACSPSEAEEIFGPVQEFIIPALDPTAAFRFRMEEGKLIQQKETL